MFSVGIITVSDQGFWGERQEDLPAEVRALLEEGIEVVELAKPVALRTADDTLRGLVCTRMEYRGDRDAGGRKIPHEVPDSEFELPFDTMLLAIDRHLPAGVSVAPPQGGLFVWLRLPDNLSSEKLLPLAREEGVTFAPGGGFFPDGFDDECHARLNFAIQTPDDIETGIRRLGKAIKRLAAG